MNVRSIIVMRLVAALGTATLLSGMLVSPAGGVSTVATATASRLDLGQIRTAGSEPATRFGTTVYKNAGETDRQAFLRIQQTYGRLGAVRLFNPRLPADWATISGNVGTTPVVVSFKAPPEEILAGVHDRELRHWFATAPTDRVTWWSYYHEPENDAAKERITAEIYKLAWTRVAALADSVQNPRLRATLTLMCWTTEAASGRNWRDYYAGNAVIDVLAFDCYNTAYRQGRYRAPGDMFAGPRAAARSAGKPWAIAEFGSLLAKGDDGRRRATWLRQSAQYLRDNAAIFCTYFDSNVSGDYRLLDKPSRLAWREVVQGQWL